MNTTTFRGFSAGFSCAAILAACVLLLPNHAFAAISVVGEVSDDADGFDAQITPSLINIGYASLANVVTTRTPDAGFQVGGLHDGMATGISPAQIEFAKPTMTFYQGLNTNPAEITFELSQAYDITSIVTIAGWGDSYFGSQQFDIGLETDNSGTFVDLGQTFGVQAYTSGGGPNDPIVLDWGFSSRTTISDDSGYIAQNVTGVRFSYSDPYPQIPSISGTVVRELMVFGTPSIPEPSAAFLLVSSCLLFTVRRPIGR